MHAIILLGGLGTRLKELYPDIPKALVPVAGRPFIEWQVDWLKEGGVTHIHLAAGHKADQIEEWAAQQTGITVSHEPQPLGTGGALKFVEPHIRSDFFLVINGDTLLPNLDFQRLEMDHQKVSNDWKCDAGFQPAHHGPEARATIAVTRIDEAGRFGTVEFDEQDRVTAFREKAQRDAGWINGGVYLMHRRALETIPADRPCSVETDIFPSWITEGRVHAFRCPPPLLDMGTPEGLDAMAAYLSGRPGRRNPAR